MIFFSVYSIIGIIWYFIILLSYLFASAFGGSLKKENITNWALKNAFEWIFPANGINYKIAFGVPMWIILWPISLTATLISKQFENK